MLVAVVAEENDEVCHIHLEVVAQVIDLLYQTVPPRNREGYHVLIVFQKENLTQIVFLHALTNSCQARHPMRRIPKIFQILNEVVPLVHFVLVDALEHHYVCVVDPTLPVRVVEPVLRPMQLVRPVRLRCTHNLKQSSLLLIQPTEVHSQQDADAYSDCENMFFGFHLLILK